MRYVKISLLLGCLGLSFIVSGQNESLDTIKVFFLGGQSNMVGRGLNKDLPQSLNENISNVWIYNGNTAVKNHDHGGLGKWAPLKSGYGAGFKSDGITNSYSKKFGVELSFGQKMKALYPKQKIAIIKYACGGTSIDSMANRKPGYWEPDYSGQDRVNHYEYFLKTINNAFEVRDINGDGKEDYLMPAGIIWMQGESDTDSEEVALRYYENLKRLMDLFRAALRNNDIPVVIGKISDSGDDADGKVWDYGEIVQNAQEKYAKTDHKASIVRSTKNYEYCDPWHYDSEAYIDLGERFAESIYNFK